LDSGIPGLSGVETVQRIRGFDEEVPIVLLRGPGDPDPSVDELSRLRIAEVLRKELSVELFLTSVELVLKRLQRQTQDHGKEPGFGCLGTILAVDDDPLARKMLKLVFESQRIRVLLASSGEEALKALAQKPDLVLLDINMPGMDGLVTLKKIKASHPQLPVIMASGMGEEEVAREALKAGAYDYISKPFNLEYMQTVVMTKVLLGIEG
jgi:DNA-binding response OmpR family regulator